MVISGRLGPVGDSDGGLDGGVRFGGELGRGGGGRDR